MEEPVKNPLELSCEEAGEMMGFKSENKITFMEEMLLEAHVKKCKTCRQKGDTLIEKDQSAIITKTEN